MIDQFAPIIPYVGAGGLRLGWTKEQVEKVTGPLGEYVAVAGGTPSAICCGSTSTVRGTVWRKSPPCPVTADGCSA